MGNAWETLFPPTQWAYGRIYNPALPESDLDLSREISREKEDRRNLGKYLGDLDLDSRVSGPVFSIALLEPRMMSSMTSSTEETLDMGWWVVLQ